LLIRSTFFAGCVLVDAFAFVGIAVGVAAASAGRTRAKFILTVPCRALGARSAGISHPFLALAKTVHAIVEDETVRVFNAAAGIAGAHLGLALVAGGTGHPAPLFASALPVVSTILSSLAVLVGGATAVSVTSPTAAGAAQAGGVCLTTAAGRLGE
jgi:hypothetical protein